MGDPSKGKLRNSALLPMRDSQLVRYRRGLYMCMYVCIYDFHLLQQDVCVRMYVCDYIYASPIGRSDTLFKYIMYVYVIYVCFFIIGLRHRQHYPIYPRCQHGWAEGDSIQEHHIIAVLLLIFRTGQVNLTDSLRSVLFSYGEYLCKYLLSISIYTVAVRL